MNLFAYFTYVFCPVMGFWLTYRHVQIVRAHIRNRVASRWEIGGIIAVQSIAPVGCFLIPVFNLFNLSLSPKVIIYLLLGYMFLFAIFLLIVSFILMKQKTDESNKPIQ